MCPSFGSSFGSIRAERLRQSILKNAFSGKLVPQDPSEEPVSELLEKIKVPKEKLVDSDKPYRQNKTIA